MPTMEVITLESAGPEQRHRVRPGLTGARGHAPRDLPRAGSSG